jgi:hypothetical protein
MGYVGGIRQVATNTLGLEERVRIGKGKETEVLALLNQFEPTVKGHKLCEFVPSNREEDMHKKIDAWCFHCGEGLEGYSVQIKYRETGGDLGVAVIRPYIDDKTFVRDCERDTLIYDRDFINTPDYYACLMGPRLLVAEGALVKRACLMMLNGLVNSGGFQGMRFYRSVKMPGAELRLVTDQGGGYSAGQQKIICYMTPELLHGAGAFLTDV